MDMIPLRTLFSRLRALFGSRRLEQDLEDEIQAHLEMEIEENVRRGMTLREARQAALREFGGVAQAKETYREQRGVPLVDALGQDIRCAWRTFRRSPGLTAVALLSLAMGIGAGAAVFTLLDQVMLRTLPVERPHELVRFEAPGPGLGMQRDTPHSLTWPFFRTLSGANGVFSGVLAEFAAEVNMTAGGQTEQVVCDMVSGSYFRVLGMGAAAGRLIGESDDLHPGAHPVAVLSYDFWTRRFGGDARILGRTITLNRTPMTIVGIAPRGFHGLDPAGYIDVMVPLMMKPQMVLWWPSLDNPTQNWLHVYARLRPGVSMGQAAAFANVLYRAHLEQTAQAAKVPDKLRKEFLARRLDVLPGATGQPGFRSYFGMPLEMLMGLAGLVLLITCANLAGLLSARTAARRTEYAIRLALGAGRARIIRQSMVESLLLALAGCLLALPVASATASILLAMLPLDHVGRAFHANPDARVLGFSIAVSVAAALLFGFAPAFQATQAEPSAALAAHSKSSAGIAPARFRKVLVASEVALALILTVTAGLFARTLYNLKCLDPGFARDSLILVNVDPTLNGYKSAQIVALADRIEQGLRAIPGVRGAGTVSWTPFNSTQNLDTLRMGSITGNADDSVEVNEVDIGAGLFAAVGLPLAAGREFTPHDDRHSPRVAIVNESFARRYYGGDAIGRILPHRGRNMEIVGVVRDFVPDDPRAARRDYAFTPVRQWEYSHLTLHIRTASAPATLFGAIRRQIRQIDPALAIADIKTMQAENTSALYIERIVALLSTSFGLLALLLATIGVYGVIAYSVARRTREIGIRIALGAGRRNVLALVMREMGMVIGAGLLAGALCLWPLGRIVQSRLFGIEPIDPLTTVTSMLLLAMVGSVAAFVPARRATAINPVNALRCE